MLQGAGARIARRDRDRSACGRGNPVHQGIARRVIERGDPGNNRETTMPVYTVHEPPRRDSDNDMIAHTARFQFVRDGFHFWAFVLAPFWMLRHRMWVEFIAYLLLVGGITFALRRLGVEETAGVWVALLLAL